MYNYHPRGPRFPRPRDFDKLRLDRAVEIYRERFSHVNGWTFLLVGSFEMDAMKTLVATYLGSLPGDKGPVPSFRDLGIRPVKGFVKKEIRKGQEAQSLISMAFTGETVYEPTEPLKLQALVDLVEIKLTEILREKLSGAYTSQITGSLTKNPYGNYAVNITIPCGPENVDKLIEATLGELQKLKTQGPDLKDLSKVKEAFIKRHQENLKDNNYWLSALQRSAEMSSNPASILTVEKRINELTVNDLRERARKYFDMKNCFQAVLYPEK
jgi:zinc protease